MLLETFKSLVARFKKHEPVGEENVTRATFLIHPSTGESSQVPDLTPRPTPSAFRDPTRG
jgi:hypothetical protein